jgi:ankyrin repeat protein
LLSVAFLCCTQTLAQIAPTAGEYAQYTGLFAAAARNDTTRIVKLLRAGEYPGMRDSHGRTPLHVAAYRRSHDAMRLLVRATHDPNVLDADGYDIVTIAAAAGDVDTLRVALGMGCSARTVAGSDETTALILAARRGSEPTVRALISSGAPVAHADKSGQSALLAAIAGGDGSRRYVATVRTLIAAGANVNVADRTGATPLALARARSYAEMASILERAGAR